MRVFKTHSFASHVILRQWRVIQTPFHESRLDNGGKSWKNCGKVDAEVGVEEKKKSAGRGVTMGRRDRRKRKKTGGEKDEATLATGRISKKMG